MSICDNYLDRRVMLHLQSNFLHNLSHTLMQKEVLPFVVGTAPSISELVSSRSYFLVVEFQSVTKQKVFIIHYYFNIVIRLD